MYDEITVSHTTTATSSVAEATTTFTATPTFYTSAGPSASTPGSSSQVRFLYRVLRLQTMTVVLTELGCNTSPIDSNERCTPCTEWRSYGPLFWTCHGGRADAGIMLTSISVTYFISRPWITDSFLCHLSHDLYWFTLLEYCSIDIRTLICIVSGPPIRLICVVDYLIRNSITD